ncbi:uncharacterized protein LOC135706214 [Ochlerotatus camptorhynchus]|uniref:uncharacterized protein LOC135706214 n=1 Tax=Ochlerotatus camptorhynchus TaxID=644619 RepID=UPI0031D8A090
MSWSLCNVRLQANDVGAKRENTLVVDFSVLPKRPDASAVQKFMYGKLKLDIVDTLNIQFHNVRNCVYVEMVDAATAKRYFASHHLQHRGIYCEKKAYKIPVFVEDEAVNVRIHDLPPKTPNTVILESMRPYGTILSISREMWKNYFPGIYNGVRVVRMKFKQLIPSYLTIDGETTLITYRNQAKTCRFGGQKAHPRQKCNSSTSRITVNDPTAQESSESDEFLTVTNKRRLSTKQKHNNAKQYITNQGCQNDESAGNENSMEEKEDELDEPAYG